MSELGFTAAEMMTVAAARRLKNGAVCFVGIGLPSTAANLARLTHAPDVVLIYESGPIGAKPDVLPLSIGDGNLAATADTVVSTPEIFRYWLQGGRIDVGFLGAAQIDRFANINTTVIGPYDKPKVRLPGAGGASEIADLAGEVLIILRHNARAFVERLDFVTSAGFLDGGDARARAGLTGRGPTAVITDLCILEPDPASKELTVTQDSSGRDARADRRGHGVADPLRRRRGDDRAAERGGARGAAGPAGAHAARSRGGGVMAEAFVCDYVRTPIGRFGGALATVRTDDLAAVPLKALMSRHERLDWAALDDVVLGCANQAGEDNRNVARMALLLAGLPKEVPGIDGEPAVRLGHGCAADRGPGDQGRRGGADGRGRHREHVAGAVRHAQGREPLLAPRRDPRHHDRLALHQSVAAGAVRRRIRCRRRARTSPRSSR